MKRTQLLQGLAAAMLDKCIVRLTRKLEPGAVRGYVVSVSEQWLLLLLIGDGIAYAGFQAFRLQDVATLDVPAPHAGFNEAVLRKRGLRRPRVPRIDLTSTQALVESAGRCFALVTLHREKADPDVCHIGRVVSVSSTSVSLLEVTPDATWEAVPTRYRLAQVTRVDVGGPYEEALALVALPA